MIGTSGLGEVSLERLDAADAHHDDGRDGLAGEAGCGVDHSSRGWELVEEMGLLTVRAVVEDAIVVG